MFRGRVCDVMEMQVEESIQIVPKTQIAKTAGITCV
jgi:hypothetical protein